MLLIVIKNLQSLYHIFNFIRPVHLVQFLVEWIKLNHINPLKSAQ
ncbi:hypothetical protein EJK54_0492 [Moraxella catarrhalis]|uniref:Uncharacterized protein n=1 Tax=Moraxella catarrhalis TaxID=480 RepID=A0ABY0BGY9_MORCA|nr:hypothetical protein EJK54_0492 [Moraxella catarrhalis]